MHQPSRSSLQPNRVSLARTIRVPLLAAAIALVLLSTTGQQARAEPLLQLYIEGATYDTASETWVLSSSSNNTFRLWTIGNVSGPGSKGRIDDVKLAAAYSSSYTSVSITLTPSTVSSLAYPTITDPSTPINTTLLQTRTDGSTPLLGDGSPLPSHGIYGPGVNWQEFALGNFTASDSPIGDFSVTFPTSLTANAGQINVYDVTITSIPADTSVEVHFDLYNHYYSKNQAKYVFAPFSHDAEGTTGDDGGGITSIAPAPPSAVLLGLGGLGFAGFATRLRRRRK